MRNLTIDEIALLASLGADALGEYGGEDLDDALCISREKANVANQLNLDSMLSYDPDAYKAEILRLIQPLTIEAQFEQYWQSVNGLSTNESLSVALKAVAFEAFKAAKQA